jgi:lysophospholipase L1-like esterase
MRAPLLLALGLFACSGETTDTDTADTDVDATAGAFTDGDTWVPAAYAEMAPTRVVFLGDSITAGAGASTQSRTYPSLLEANDASAWPEGDGHDLATLYPDLTDVIDVSVGGATTSSMLRDQLPALEAQLDFPAEGETLIVFTIGGNDMQSALVPGANVRSIINTARDNVEAMVDWFQDGRFPDGVRIFATNGYEPSDGVGQVATCFFGISYADKMDDLIGYNDDLRSMAQDKGFAAVDMFGHFQGHGFYADNADLDVHDAGDPTVWFDDDCIHPNDRGHHEIRELFWGAMAREAVQ